MLSQMATGAFPAVALAILAGCGCRGTFLGAPWGPFSDVKEVWSEIFASKPYTCIPLGIAGIPSFCFYQFSTNFIHQSLLATSCGMQLKSVNLLASISQEHCCASCCFRPPSGIGRWVAVAMRLLIAR